MQKMWKPWPFFQQKKFVKKKYSRLSWGGERHLKKWSTSFFLCTFFYNFFLLFCFFTNSTFTSWRHACYCCRTLLLIFSLSPTFSCCPTTSWWVRRTVATSVDDLLCRSLDGADDVKMAKSVLHGGSFFFVNVFLILWESSPSPLTFLIRGKVAPPLPTPTPPASLLTCVYVCSVPYSWLFLSFVF